MKLLIAIVSCLALVANTTRLPVGKPSSSHVPAEDEQRIMRNQGLRLLSTSETDAKWASPEDYMNKEIQFIDITDHVDLQEKSQEVRDRISAQYRKSQSLSSVPNIHSLADDFGAPKGSVGNDFSNQYGSYEGAFSQVHLIHESILQVKVWR